MVELLEKEDLHIKGVTPNLTTEEISKTKKFSLVKADVKQHQVKPDQTVGLTLENVKEAVKILMG